MKKKRSIQKLNFHKEKISKLNAVTGGANITTTIIKGVTIAVSVAAGSCYETCTESRGTENWMICISETETENDC